VRRAILQLLVTSLIALIAVPLVANGASAAFPGANGKIAFAEFGGFPGIWVVNPDGSGLTQVSAGDDDTPAWSPSGTMIAFARHQGPLDDYDIWVMGADGSNARDLTPGSTSDDRHPAWSPDGKKLVYSGILNDEQGPTQLYTVNVVTGVIKQLTHDAMWDWQPAWSPTGTRIAFIDSNSHFLWVVNARGTKEHRVDKAYDGSPNWSPDGAEIVFSREARGSKQAIVAIHPDGTGRRQIVAPNGELERQPAWSPDGTKIVYLLFPDQLWIVGADGSHNHMFYSGDSPGSPDWQALP
jgi:Tol biopolymer transport system component